MFTFQNSFNLQIQWPDGPVSHPLLPPGSKKRLSSFTGDLNSFSSGAKSFFSFAQAYADRSFGLPLIFAAR
jgi:hypothetical protein